MINGTGVILHTNLGRAPFGEETAEHVARLMTGYTNLELDLETGKRGSRLASFQQDLESFTGAEAVAVVNNNAAAVLLMLTVLAFATLGLVFQEGNWWKSEGNSGFLRLWSKAEESLLR